MKKRRRHKKAIIAIARMLLTAIYNILKENQPYDSKLYRKADRLTALIVPQPVSCFKLRPVKQQKRWNE